MGKVIAAQQLFVYYKTIRNIKITTRNEKVACSSQVTSSKNRTTSLEVVLFLLFKIDSKIRKLIITKAYVLVWISGGETIVYVLHTH